MNKNEILKIGLLGGAINSAVGSAHYAALRLDNQYELVTGCFSLNEGFNKKTAQQYIGNANRVYNSLDELIETENKNIDAIVILTPTDQHADQVIKCIKKGIPVICEKALGCSVAEVKKIEHVLKSEQGFLAVIYNYLGYPMLRELQYMIQQGELGNLHHIQIEMPQEGFSRVGLDGKPIIPQEWRLHDGIIPTISLDLGVHLHIIVKYLTGEKPVNVVATSQSFGNFETIKDNVSCMIEYTNNLICNMWYSKIAIGNRNGLKIRVYGDIQSAEWIQENPEYLMLANNKGYRWTMDRGSVNAKICNQLRYTRFKAGHPAGFIEAFANYYYDIAASLKCYATNKISYLNENCFGITDALEGLQLLDMIAKSGATKTWQSVEMRK